MKSVRAVIVGALLAVPLAIVGGAGPASADVLSVVSGAADNAACADAPHPTITQAIGCAADGDTITVGPGTFLERVVVNKNLTIRGSGAGATFIDGDGVNTLPGPAQVYVEAGGDVTLADLTVRDAGANNDTARHYSIYLRGPGIGTATGTHTLSGVVVEGGGISRPDTGVYCYASAAEIVIEDSTLTEIAGNAVLLENCTGEVRIEGNDFDQGLVGDAAVYSMRYSGSESAAPQLVTGNRFSGAGLSYNGSFFGATETVGHFSNLEISDNDFSGMAIGVGIFNRSTLAGGANGTIDDVVISGNTFTGTGTSHGVRLTGLITDVDLTGNTITDQGVGVRLVTAVAGHTPTGVTASGNRIVGNVIGAETVAPASLDARRNFWGCNEGPGAVGCDTVVGTVDAEPWLVLAFAPAPAATVVEGGATTFGVTTFVDSDDAEGLAGVPGTPEVVFAATGGTIDPTAAPLDGGQLSPITFQADQGDGDAQLSATLDNATITWTLEVTAEPTTPTPTPTPTPAPRALPATATPTYTG